MTPLDADRRIDGWTPPSGGPMPLALPVLAIVSSLIVSGLLLLATGFNPLISLGSLVSAGFGCAGSGQCALLTTLQFATPLLLTGLSAVVAFRAGVFSVGQAGQMLLGAAAAAGLSASIDAPGVARATIALLGGVAAGAMWGWIPGVLKVRLNINEVIVTLVLNRLAVLLVGLAWFGRVGESARLAQIAPGSKLNVGIALALLAIGLIYVWLWRATPGYEQRMAGQAPLFAQYGGIRREWAVIRGMLLSGGLAGLAGAIEVLGVHYRFVSAFAGGGGFDGVAVALLGQSHPVGVLFSAVLLAGVRVGSIAGLQIQSQVPRELGEAMIAMMLVFVSAGWAYRGIAARARR